MRLIQAMVCAAALAGPGDISGARGEPLAMLELDPRGFGATAAWFGPLLRVLDAAGVVRAEDRAVADAVLAASVLGTHPSTTALLQLDARRFLPGEVEIESLQLVLTIHLAPAQATARHAEFRQTLQTILGHYGLAHEREQRAIDLPGGRQGVRYRLLTWPGWMCVEWCAEADALVLGIGEGSLQRWLERDLGQPDARLAAHEHALSQLPTADDSRPLMLRLFADLSRLRASAPTLFATGRLSPSLRVFGWHDADRLLLEARWRETFLLLAGSVARGEMVTAHALSLDHWPEDAGVPMPPGRFHLVAPIDWPGAASRVVRFLGVLREGQSRTRYNRWVRDHFGPQHERLTNQMARFHPLLLMSDHPQAWLPLPGTATAYLTLQPEADLGESHQGLQRLLAPGQREPDDEPDDLAIVTDPATGVQWLDSPMRGLFKAPAWGWQERTFIFSYSPVAVIENQRLLRGTAPQPAATPK